MRSQQQPCGIRRVGWLLSDVYVQRQLYSFNRHDDDDHLQTAEVPDMQGR